ncbi:hypothetical protein PGT21_000632 [Puccinia graminis f. sp. tritici]|uniref:Uncharacterized protein n=1 Tax=Puccinia graminis f. sp. tritici TaxID=56615 RepID=A0A5B0P2B6_PUCGR|nr:hypothetical protein PGT21_000632 [Puccinia graminis f. sp. tritici]
MEGPKSAKQQKIKTIRRQGPKVYASEDIPSSQQASQPSLSKWIDQPHSNPLILSGCSHTINSFARQPVHFRCTKGRLKWMKGALTPLNTRVEHEEDSPAPVKTDSLDVSQVENLKDHLLELKRKHQEYMDDIKQLVEVCQCRIGQAADSGERRITGPIDIGSRLLSRTTKPLVRKRLDSLTEQPTPKKACLAETNRIVEDTEDTPMESSANTQHERQHPSRAILTHSSPPYDSVTSSPNPDTSGMSLAAREVSVEASSSYSPLPSSLDIPQTQLSEERKELPVSDDDPPDDDPPEALTIEKAVLNPKSPLSPNGLPPSNAHSSSHNVPITPQPAEKDFESRLAKSP